MQLKGCRKKTVCLRPTDGRLFEEAFFVLRDGEREADEGDMLNEANRILEESSFCQPRKRHPRLFPFLLGAGCGAAGAALLFLLVFLLS